MKAIERIIDKAHLDRKRVVLSEAEDPRVLKAARLAIDKQLAYITLVGDEKAIVEAAQLHHINLAGIHIVSPQTSALKTVLAERLYELRKAKGMTYEDALEKVKDSLIFANLMVREGLVDGTVNGAVYTTSDVVRAALWPRARMVFPISNFATSTVWRSRSVARSTTGTPKAGSTVSKWRFMIALPNSLWLPHNRPSGNPASNSSAIWPCARAWSWAPRAAV